MKKFFAEFKKFALKGNMIDLAVGMIIGTAFNNIVKSLVNDMFMPVLSLFTGKLDFANWFIALDGNKYLTIEAAKEAGAATVCLTSYAGSPITQISDHVLTVFCVETRYPVEASSARIAQTCVIDALVAVLSTMCYEKATQRSRQMHDLLEAVRYQKRR